MKRVPTTELGKLIRASKKAKGFNNMDVAYLLCSSDSSISSWELGKSIPRRDNAKMIVQALDISVEKYALAAGGTVEDYSMNLSDPKTHYKLFQLRVRVLRRKYFHSNIEGRNEIVNGLEKLAR